MTEIKSYGSWRSTITADLIVAGVVGLGQIATDNDDIYWVESRPSEGGRSSIVRLNSQGQTSDITPPPYNVRNRVHEYGGVSFTVANGDIYFSNFADNRIYYQKSGSSEILPLTPEINWRYADIILDPIRPRLICIREDHTVEGEPVNTIVSINLENGDDIQVLATGYDFYSSPRLSSDGSQLAWLSWRHPNMPWDGTELWVANVNIDGTLGEKTLIAGGINESIFQPEWSPDQTLYFVSDRSNWWNLYRWRSGVIESLVEMDAEFGLPQWVFGMSTYALIGADQIVCTYSQKGIGYLATIDLISKELTSITTDHTDFSAIKVKNQTHVVFLGGSPTNSAAIIQLELATGKTEILQKSSQLQIEPGYLSIPESIEFPTNNGLTAYALYYPPKNQNYTAPKGEKPPLLVKSHGGPTAATSSVLSLKTQYWTSRGFAVLDVNYGGSTGYGREYRQRLQNQWGIIDVDDCVNGAKYLEEKGLVDGEKMAISGGSAGGYTTLCALTFRNVFKAGASHYGVSDLIALATDTHKFESRYLDGLIGAYPEREDLYRARSPIYFTDKLASPAIFFQGLEDKVVPPNQAEMMVNAIKAKGLPVAYITFPEEQHGFRRSENIKRAIEGEFYFYSQVFKFELGDAIEPISIDNL